MPTSSTRTRHHKKPKTPPRKGPRTPPDTPPRTPSVSPERPPTPHTPLSLHRHSPASSTSSLRSSATSSQASRSVSPVACKKFVEDVRHRGNPLLSLPSPNCIENSPHMAKEFGFVASPLCEARPEVELPRMPLLPPVADARLQTGPAPFAMSEAHHPMSEGHHPMNAAMPLHQPQQPLVNKQFPTMVPYGIPPAVQNVTPIVSPLMVNFSIPPPNFNMPPPLTTNLAPMPILPPNTPPSVSTNAVVQNHPHMAGPPPPNVVAPPPSGVNMHCNYVVPPPCLPPVESHRGGLPPPPAQNTMPRLMPHSMGPHHPPPPPMHHAPKTLNQPPVYQQGHLAMEQPQQQHVMDYRPPVRSHHQQHYRHDVKRHSSVMHFAT